MAAAPQGTTGARSGPGTAPRRGALDPRLLRYARTTRRFVVQAIAIGGVTALLVVAQAWLIATVVNEAFFHHGSLSSLRDPLVLLLLAVIVGRAVLAWATERTAHRASASAKSELRHSAAEHIAALGRPAWSREDNGRLTVLVTTGIDALDGYFSRYLPQLFLAVIVPVTIIAVVAGADWISAALIAVTVPLIPVFMGLVGLTTRDRTAARMRSLQRLAGHFLDVVAGLPTLKVFGRAKAQARAIAEVTDRYRTTTLATLRLTFLSSLVLELLATVSVALVAVAVGLRLLDGHMNFHAALFVLVLAPEAYLPLRALGANFHASADGMKAAEQVFELLETPVGEGIGGLGPAAGHEHPDHRARGQLPGPPHPGPARRRPRRRAGRDRGPHRSQRLWQVHPPRRRPRAAPPRFGPGPARRGGPARPRPRRLAGRHRLGAPAAAPLRPLRGRQRPRRATRRQRRRGGGRRWRRPDWRPSCGACPHGVDTRLGDGGAGLSLGERQRLALARAFVRDAALLVLDEPTASLDAETEADVLDAVRRLTEGRTALVVAHRPALAALADRVVLLPLPAVAA